MVGFETAKSGKRRTNMLGALISNVLPAMLAAQTGGVPTIVDPAISQVSMFKNGYAYVIRRIPIKEAQTNVVQVPLASLGTLWFWTSSGELESISTATSMGTTEVEALATNFDLLVTQNVGRTVNLEVRQPNASVQMLEGKILASQGELVIIETAKGRQVFSKSTITSVTSNDPAFVWTTKVPRSTESKYYAIKTKGAKEVMMMSLERGVTWAPAYAVDITEDKKLTLASKATLLNDSLELSNVNLRLITGFPNLMFQNILDPFSSGMSVDMWLNSLAGSPGGSGGFAGRRSELMTQNAAAPMADMSINWGGPNVENASGEQIGDLFFYDLPKFNLKKGSRTYQNLFKFESDYQHVYTWQIEDQVDQQGNYRPVPINQPSREEVWHTIRFKNASGRPLTTAAATIFQKGELIGQAMLNYTPNGTECQLRINKALEVTAEANEEEISRERGAIKDQYNNPRWDLVTVKGVLEAQNNRKESIRTEITKQLTGGFISGTGQPEVTKTTKGLRQMNGSVRLKWKTEIKPGEKLNLEYSYSLYVPSG